MDTRLRCDQEQPAGRDLGYGFSGNSGDHRIGAQESNDGTDGGYIRSSKGRVIDDSRAQDLRWPDWPVSELKRVIRGHVLITIPREPFSRGVNKRGQWRGPSPEPGYRQFWSHASFQSFIDRHLVDPSFRTKHVYPLTLGRV